MVSVVPIIEEMMVFEIKDTLIPVFKRYGDQIVFAYLFGSIAKSEVSDLSDVDIAVYLTGDIKEAFFEIKLSLYTDICRVLKRNDVDFVVLNTATNLMLIADIIRYSVVIYDIDVGVREDLKIKHLHESIDFKTHRFAVMGF